MKTECSQIFDDKLEPFTLREIQDEDVEGFAKLSALDKNEPWQAFEKVFQVEATYCKANPEKRTYFVIESKSEIIAYAGARSYEQGLDENMYGTEALLPDGWYLRGIRVHCDFRRRGFARALTLARLKWLSSKSDHAFVFLDDEHKITIPMYLNLGFHVHSRNWNFLKSNPRNTNARGILLKYQFPKD